MKMYSKDDRTIINLESLKKPVDNVIFDLDDTLYNFNTGIFYAMNGQVIKVFTEAMGISHESANKLQHDMYTEYGTNTRGIIKTKANVSLTKFLTTMHDVDLSVINKDERLVKNIEDIKESGKNVYILSNALHEPYIPKVLDRIGIPHKLFDGIMGSEDTHHLSKPREEPFKIMFDRFNINPERTLFVEDSHKNLETAKKFGMQTFLLLYPESKHFYMFSEEAQKGKLTNTELKNVVDKMPYVDYASLNLNTGLEKVLTDRLTKCR